MVQQVESFTSIVELIEEYYKNNRADLCNKIGRRVFSEHDVEDIVQEAFTKALKYSRCFREGGNLPAWIGIILDNCVKEYRTDFLYNKAGMSHHDSEEFDEENTLLWKIFKIALHVQS